MTDFPQRLLAVLTGGALTPLIGLGDRLGLFDALADDPATSAELAARTGLHERYVREWLGAMVTGELLAYDPADRRYRLPPEHAPLLAGDRSSNVGPSASMLQAMVSAVPELQRRFVDGGGVPPERFADTLRDIGSAPGQAWRRIYDEHLVDGFLGAVPGLTERLADGVDVLDVGCGSGHAMCVAGAAFPLSRFTGLDIAPAVIATAEAERSSLGLDNVRFVTADAAQLPARPGYDVITAFDAVHDQHDPLRVLRAIRAALAPGGVFVMVDTRFSRDLENNVGNPHAALCYAISLMFCTTTSLSEGGAALGAVWGQELALELLDQAGFGSVTVHDSPRPQNSVVVCQER